MKNLTTTKNDAELFVDLVMRGVDCWIQAGEIVARNLDANPNFIDEVCDKCKDLSPETVLRFAQIGRKQLLPRLLLSDEPGIRRLRRLPYQIQERFAAEPVSVVTVDGDIIKIDVRNLTPDQASQVFADDRIRSEGEQRAWSEDRKAKQISKPAKANAPYRIVGKKLMVMTPCQLTSREMAQLIAEMEG